MIFRFIQGGLALIFLVGLAGCTEEEPRYCDAVTNKNCATLPGHHCNFARRACEPNEAGVAAADAGGAG